MTLWLILPRDPLIFRDGKPFSNIPGSRAKTMPFPYPSTLAGAVRTSCGKNPATGHFDDSRIDELLRINIKGPFLAKVDHEGEISDWMLPAPDDAVLFSTEEDEDYADLYALRPIEIPAGNLCDLKGDKLAHFSKIIKAKPHPKLPEYWYWSEFKQWLILPSDRRVRPDDMGIAKLPLDTRIHVSIDPKTLSAAPGELFQTTGLEFSHRHEKDGLLRLSSRYALAIDTDADLKEGPGFLGGERRVVNWRRVDDALPECPLEVRKSLLETPHTCRLILTTPAYFEDGYMPHWFTEFFGFQVEVISAIVSRYQTISGWDYQARHPKPTRRLAPAGSVYYLKLFPEEGGDIDSFIDKTWLMPISDDIQSRLDGFGIAVLGTWDGNLLGKEVLS